MKVRGHIRDAEQWRLRREGRSLPPKSGADVIHSFPLVRLLSYSLTTTLSTTWTNDTVQFRLTNNTKRSETTNPRVSSYNPYTSQPRRSNAKSTQTKQTIDSEPLTIVHKTKNANSNNDSNQKNTKRLWRPIDNAHVHVSTVSSSPPVFDVSRLPLVPFRDHFKRTSMAPGASDCRIWRAWIARRWWRRARDKTVARWIVRVIICGSRWEFAVDATALNDPDGWWGFFDLFVPAHGGGFVGFCYADIVVMWWL